MSFRELLQQAGPENLVPSRVITTLLSIDKKDIDASLALLLAEVLVPGSQKLTTANNGVTALSSTTSLPEATAKGAQLSTCLKTVDSDPQFSINWYLVFSKVQENLFDSMKRNVSPPIISINQFLAAVDFKNGLLDIFLNYDWYFSKTLLYVLHQLDPKQGTYDINASPNLTRCFDDDIETTVETQLGKKNIVSFINIGKLELTVINRIKSSPPSKSQEEERIDTFLLKIFDHHCHVFPEYLISAALAIVDKNQFLLDLIDTLFASLVDNNSKFLGKVLEKFKELDNQLAMNKLIKFFTSRNTTESILKIAKLSLDMNFFDEVLAMLWPLNFPVTVSFIVNASCYDYDLKPVINEKFSDPQQKLALCQSLVEIVEKRSSEDFAKGQDPAALQAGYKILRIPVVYFFLEKLKSSNGIIDAERLKNLQLQLLTTYPRLINFGTGHDKAILANGQETTVFSPNVEQEMKAYYSKMYNKELEIKEIVDMLVRLKTSDVPHDQEIFACMIHSLLDEYRFFPEYPLTALASTSLLFGALLQKDLIQGTTLTVALNFIWESCNQPQDSHLFKFAVQALYNFKSRLHEYPIYCKHLLECKSLSAHAKMYQIVKDASNGIQCGETTSKEPSKPGTAEEESVGVVYQSINFTESTIGNIPQTKPNEVLTDKLLFFVNNLTSDNLKTKLPEVKDSLTENFFLWFADYLVAERAKSEPNNHQLYCEFVNQFDNPIFFEYILNVSLREVKGTLKNFKDSFNDRNHLKNLGSWLGQITLASDKPLKRYHIALKFLLVEAFDNNTLSFIIPFVCKILDQAQHSKIFKPPNPWIMGIIKVLVELYECADLKLNLKFEIEVLLNTYKLTISDVQPSTLVRNHNPRPEALALMFGIQGDGSALANDFSKMNIEFDPSHPQYQGGAQGPQQPLIQPQQPPQQPPQQQQQQQGLLQQPQQQQQQLPPQLGAPRGGEENIPGAPQPAQGGASLDTSFGTLVGNTIFTQNPNLRRAFQASLSRAVRECAIPILSRTSESVLTTTEALVKKDLAYEGDVNKFRKAYQTLALKLSQSMIACSGRKILSETIEATMIQLLAHQINPNDLPLGELTSAIQSNVDLCVDIINKIAAGNIIELIEERMKSSVLARERHQPGTPFVETGASDYALKLPPPLGLTTEGLSPNQLAIYEAFGSNIPRSDVLAAQAAQAQNQAAQAQSQAAQAQSQAAQAQSQAVQAQSQAVQAQNQAAQAQNQPAQPPNLQQLPQQVAPQQLGLNAQGQGLAAPPNAQISGQNQNIASQSQTTPQPQLSGLVDDYALNIEQMFVAITQNCDKAIQGLADIKETQLSELPVDGPIMQSISNVLSLSQANALKYPELLLKVAQYTVNCLFTQSHQNPMSNEIYVVILDKLCEYSPSTAKDVTWWLVHSSDQRKLNMPVMYSLLKVQLVLPTKLDSSLGKLIRETPSAVLVKFASNLLYSIFVTKEAKPIALRSEFGITIDALSKYEGDDSDEEVQVAKKARSTLFELLNQTLEAETLDSFTQMGYIFTEWTKLLTHGETVEGLQAQFVKGLLHHGILTDSKLFGSFFKAAVQVAISAFATEHDLRARTQHETYLAVDALALLIVRIVLMFNKKQPGEAIAYLKNVMGVLVLSFTGDHETPGAWNERAYFRLFSSLLCFWSDASIMDADATTHLDGGFYNFIGDLFNGLQPIVFPGFTFAWISLISHRMFLPRLLELPDGTGQSTAVKVLTSLLRFESYYAKDETVNNDVINVIFKAINRIFVSISHDYPEFLAENHHQLVCAVPESYVQLRNIILSATPKSVALVDPFTQGLKVERIPEIVQAPVIRHQPGDDLSKAGVKKPVDNFLRIPAPALMRSVYNGLKLNQSKAANGFGYDSVNYNVNLINALVLYVGMGGVEEKTPNGTKFNPKSSHVVLLVDLMNYGSAELKFHLVNGIANQLRYPNSHTQWFVGVLLHFFGASNVWSSPETKLSVQEIITRVLLERHMVNKPHPWGLTIVFTELVKNGEFGLFELPFIKAAPQEVRLIFEALMANISGK